VDEKILEAIAEGIVTGIGILLVGGAANHALEKWTDRNNTIENEGRKFERNLSQRAEDEVRREMMKDNSILPYSKLVSIFLRRHPEKRIQWEKEIDYYKAIYRAQFDKGPSIPVKYETL